MNEYDYKNRENASDNKNKGNIINIKNINPQDIRFFKNIISDSKIFSFIENSFIVFESIHNLLCLIYTNQKNSIISYDLAKNIKINEIKNAHKKSISNYRYCLDKIKKRELIISISLEDNNIKLWDFNNLECLFKFKEVNKEGIIYSACFLEEKNHIYIITSNNNNLSYLCEPIKIFDINGNKMLEINNSKDRVYYIDSFYDYKTSKNYIITGNFGYIKSYDYYNNNLYHKYESKSDFVDFQIRYHCHIIVVDNNKNGLNLIDASYEGNIRLWEFHSGKLLKIIKIKGGPILNICLWNEDNIFVSNKHKALILIDLERENIIKSLEKKKIEILSIKKIFIPQYGNCLIAQDSSNNINLWIDVEKMK